MTSATQGLTRIETAVLTHGPMRATLLNYGAITQGWWYKDLPLTLGFDDPTTYFSDTRYMGAVVGRVANRIGGARFMLGDRRIELSANEGSNTLHGGNEGLSSRFWHLEQNAPNEASLTYLSRDGESGFPGEVRFEVHITLQYPRLTYTFTAFPDRPTPISLAQHNYYILGSSVGVDEHKLKIASDRRLEIDDHGIPSGHVCLTKESKLDFSMPKSIGSVPDGIDNYFCFDQNRDPSDPIAVATAPSGLALSVYSDQPGAQIYTGARLAKPLQGSAGLCIEPSGYPDAPNHAVFPSIMCTPETPYRQVLTLEITEGSYES